MAKTRRRTTGALVPFSLWCVVLLGFLVDAAQANVSNSSSIVSSDGQTGDESETTVEKGMRPFFDMVKTFLGVIQPHKLTEQSWLNVSEIYKDGGFNTDQFKDWQDWATYLIGFVVCAAVGVLFFIVMPIVGLVFCCCRCCGRCGGRRKPHDPKHAGCKRKSYCTLLLLFNTVTLAGVVCAFLSNEIVYEKLRNENDRGPTGKLTSTLDYVDNYINRTLDEIEEAVLDKFITAKDTIIQDVRNTASDAVDDVLGQLNATALLDQTKDLSRVVNQTRDELTNVATELSTLNSLGDWLAGNLTQIADQIDAVCGQSSFPRCDGYDRNKYAVSANFSRLGDLSDEAKNVADAVDLGKYIGEAEDTISSTKNTTTFSVENGINNATKSVDEVEQTIDRGVKDIKQEVKNSVTDRTTSVRSDLQSNQEDVSEYSKYGWYGGLAVCCVLLLVVVLYYVGVLFGLCGERPGLGAQCCNTGTGANFLMAGVGLTFLLAWLVMLVCVILFVTGGVFYTELCRYFVHHDPQQLKPFNDAVMEAVDFQKGLFNGKDVNLDLIDILEGCKRNEPIYSVMKLDNMVNLTQYTDLTPLRRSLDSLKQDNFNIPNITIVTPSLNKSVNEFADAGLNQINFTDYYTEVNKNLTAGDLTALANSLRQIAQLPAAGGSFKRTLEDSADSLVRLQNTLHAQMSASVSRLNASLRALETFRRSAVQESVDTLMTGLQVAQDNFNRLKDARVKQQLGAVIQRVLDTAEKFIQEMLTDVNENIGKCRPLFDGIYSATDAVCVVVLEPVNGFWFSVGWCLFFFIPCLIFAVKLAGLYRREHDEKDFEDPNYILYGGGNQDTIPLTSVDRGNPSAYPGSNSGMANSAYHRDSYMGPTDKYAPPPYGYPPNGMGSAVLNGSRGGLGMEHGRGPKPYPY